MKVYAIKRDDGEYLKVTINSYGDFNDEEFVKDLYDATLYANHDLEYAEYKCNNLRDCKIVECELIETKFANKENKGGF